MAKGLCNACGHIITWNCEDAFSKFGFGDGAVAHFTEQVVNVLEAAGYTVHSKPWGLHNTVIVSIKRDGVELIPATATIGYDAPRGYLPKAIIQLLDQKLAEEAVA